VKADLEKMAKFIDLIKENPRIRIERLQSEMEMPRSTVYRWIQAVSSVIPLRLENGVIIQEKPNHNSF